MITPRHTRLIRVPDLAALRSVLADLVAAFTPAQARDSFFLVPTSAAAEQFRRTLEDRLLLQQSVLVLPIIGTRSELYHELASRLPSSLAVLTAFEREVLLGAVARAVDARGVRAPFDIRPALVAEMLSLYDQVRRMGRTIDDFERNIGEHLEHDADDRGAAKLLQQTRFLAASYRAYESAIETAVAVDEHALRERLLATPAVRPLERVVLTVADRTADPDGLWPADFDLLSRLPSLQALDILCTEAALAAGLIERLHASLPGLEEERAPFAPSPKPALMTPPRGVDESLVLRYRDREEELCGVARRIKADRRNGRAVPLPRIALVVQRPLPYLYLARDVFSGAGVPFETVDTLPLAAEPYAAAVDLVLDAIGTDFTRYSLLALVRSPHFDFSANGRAVTADSIAALDFALAEARYLGGLERLGQLSVSWRAITAATSREERRRQTAAPAVGALHAALETLRPLAGDGAMAGQIETLVSFLRRFDRRGSGDTQADSRRDRVRAAVLGALTALAAAYRRFDPEAIGSADDVGAAMRRWLGGQTFAVPTGTAGVQLLDARAARYGEFDDVQLLGLVEGDWPERVRRNVLYPPSLLSLLEPLSPNADPARRERESLQAARAMFRDLVHLAQSRVTLSTVLLENDAVVEPSILLDDLPSFELPRETRETEHARIFRFEALALDPPRSDVIGPPARIWAEARTTTAQTPPVRGEAGPWTFPRVSVSRLERYLDCPFRFFASEVLRLEEQPEDEDTRTPLERGRFLHELFERFYAEWQRRGHGRIDPTLLPEARVLFTSLCEDALAMLPPSEATLERARLLGSAVSAGIAHRVFAMEAERPVAVIERLLEFPLQGDFVFTDREGRTRTVRLSAKTDRIDLLADGTMRVIDYKSKKTPDVKQALQLPIYSRCARTSLEQARGRAWRLTEAVYLSFEGERAVVPLRARHRTLEDLIADAEDRLLASLDAIAAGHFPPQPAKRSLCGPCPYRTVCRLEWVEEAQPND